MVSLSAIPAHSARRGSDAPPALCVWVKARSAVTDQLGAGFLVNGRNAGGAVKRHEQGPILPPPFLRHRIC
jgi:hypothetical protein